MHRDRHPESVRIIAGYAWFPIRIQFDLGTPAGRLMAGVPASVAAYETEVRKEQ
jgi:hypothetical protein